MNKDETLVRLDNTLIHIENIFRLLKEIEDLNLLKERIDKININFEVMHQCINKALML